MNKKSFKYNDEIDLIKLIKIIWYYKIKIILITLFTTVLISGYGNMTKKPDLYELSIGITVNKNSEFDTLLYLNRIAYGEDYLEKSTYGKKVSKSKGKISLSAIYLEKFLEELMDYEEFLYILKNKNYIEKNTSQIPLYTYAKSLILEKDNSIGSNGYILEFSWHNADDAKEILNETLKLVSLNLKNNIFKEIERYAETINRLSVYSDQRKIQYLKEQSLIAKRLNIKENQLTTETINNFTNSDWDSEENFSYYLRGYDAIDKKISSIQDREYTDLINIQKEIAYLKKNNFIWAKYNIASTNVRLIKEYSYIRSIITAVIIGLVIGLIYAFVANEFQSRRPNRKIK